MTTQPLHSLRCSLALLLAGVAPVAVAGCDQGSEFDTGAEELTAEDLDIDVKTPIDGDADEEDAAGPAQDHNTMEVLAAPDSPSAAVITTHSHRSVLLTDTLEDGDVVMLRSVGQGYLGCNDAGAIQTSKAPNNTDGRLWRVHLVDLDGDGNDEMQFELVDGGYTNKYLSMHDFGFTSFVFCGTLQGAGEAASWSWGHWYGQNGSVYRKVSRSLVNFDHNKCIHSTSAIPAIGGACNHHVHTMFNMEVLDTAVM
ncbi:MAG: hypothetical protein AAF799_31710 [Myxococcota bacterium]